MKKENYVKEINWSCFSTSVEIKGDIQLPEIISFLCTRKRFINDGQVSVSQEYCNFDFDSLEVESGERVVTRESTDWTQSSNGGDYEEWYENLVVYEDDNVVVFFVKHSSSYDGGCCPECGNYCTEGRCCQPTIHCINKNRQEFNLHE